ncbi:hypothetical protein FisN_12Lu010 [Fistulifera solaris]|jgi:surface protein|uniref:BspA family leucine-rich repeat surface protein n=1 Tax=Fistulifera solaris TaxID=1519565 RepID=A0A1Z5KGT2_FISSO|nr:hypothetical protein FisN_12Lu010 [Fistulifera solaris]|eukprot:GAX25469.1 hypothetical protein FisN_12Lu010 [Fistulifera solaris]
MEAYNPFAVFARQGQLFCCHDRCRSTVPRRSFEDKAELQAAVAAWTASKSGVPPSNWDVAKVDDFSELFKDNTQFNEDISGWNTEFVYTMASMFEGATAFNQDISGWNTEITSNMNRMFYGASAFNQDLCPWYQQLRNVDDMFVGTNCPNKNDPGVANYCFNCEN